jgi:hypothetical protein
MLPNCQHRHSESNAANAAKDRLQSQKTIHPVAPHLEPIAVLAICSLLLLRLLLLLPCLTPLLLPLLPMTCCSAFSSSVLHNHPHDMIVLSSLSPPHFPWLLSPVPTQTTMTVFHSQLLSVASFLATPPCHLLSPILLLSSSTLLLLRLLRALSLSSIPTFQSRDKMMPSALQHRRQHVVFCHCLARKD